MNYDNNNRGVAFTNDYKKEDKHPHFRGKGNYENQEFDIAVWVKQKDGKKFLTFSFSEPYKKDVTETDKVVDVTDGEIDLSSIPF